MFKIASRPNNLITINPVSMGGEYRSLILRRTGITVPVFTLKNFSLYKAICQRYLFSNIHFQYPVIMRYLLAVGACYLDTILK